MKLKEIVFIVVVFFLIKSFDDLLSRHNYDLNCLFDPKTYTNEPIGLDNTTINDTVYIKGLGDFNQSDLELSKQILEDKFGVICKIDGFVSTDNDFYSNNGRSLEETKTFNKILSNNKVVYITNELLFDDETGKSLKGSSSNKTIIVRTKTLKNTLIHEFGHLLGLGHCDNKVCVMGTHNSKITNDEFCDKCKKQLGL
jgi:hypothetical protein